MQVGVGKTSDDMSDQTSKAIGSIYKRILDERAAKKAKEDEEKALRKAAKAAEEKDTEEVSEDGKPLTKAEKREKALSQWREIISNLTGDDLEYTSPKKRKKKYKQWLDQGENLVEGKKPKKKKKTNYKKEFAPELDMLKRQVDESKKFTDGLSRRYGIMVGPNVKDAMPLNKTQVEMASAVIASRNATLGILSRIVDVKKSAADLEMKRKKMKGGAGDGAGNDMGLIGASIASDMYRSSPGQSSNNWGGGFSESTPSYPETPSPSQSFSPYPTFSGMPQQDFEEVDPSSMKIEGVTPDGYTLIENRNTEYVIERSRATGVDNVRIIDKDNGEDLTSVLEPQIIKIKAADPEKGIARDDVGREYPFKLVD
jgi:hypothetical protein